MNGLGVGLAVGLGTVIGLRLVAPSVDVSEGITTLVFYGGISGFLFEIYRLALSWRHPFRR
jgi:hypothetical protein